MPYLKASESVSIKKLCFEDGTPSAHSGSMEHLAFQADPELHPSEPAQTFGNCTVYNLKKILKIAFSMNELTYGCFEDSLVVGTDFLISKALGSAPVTPCAKGQGSGAAAGTALPVQGAAQRIHRKEAMAPQEVTVGAMVSG